MWAAASLITPLRSLVQLEVHAQGTPEGGARLPRVFDRREAGRQRRPPAGAGGPCRQGPLVEEASLDFERRG